MLNIMQGNIAKHSQFYYIYIRHMSINMIYISAYPQHDSLSTSVSFCKVWGKSRGSNFHERASYTYTFKLSQNKIFISDLKIENYIQFNKRIYIHVSNVMLYIDCLMMKEEKREKSHHHQSIAALTKNTTTLPPVQITPPLIRYLTHHTGREREREFGIE